MTDRPASPIRLGPTEPTHPKPHSVLQRKHLGSQTPYHSPQAGLPHTETPT